MRKGKYTFKPVGHSFSPGLESTRAAHEPALTIQATEMHQKVVKHQYGRNLALWITSCARESPSRLPNYLKSGIQILNLELWQWI